MPDRENALIVGVGPGLGSALARRFAEAKMAVGVAARNAEALAPWVEAASRLGGEVRAYACDATDEAAVDALFDNVKRDIGTPRLVVYNAGTFVPAGILDIATADFEKCWRVGCLGGFLVGQRAARGMLARPESEEVRGTIVFTGATASLRGSARFANLAVGKFGLRALAQSMARELGPQGVHVAHVIIDGQIAHPKVRGAAPNDSRLGADAIAGNYLMLHRQNRSAWTHELDLRPWSERF